MPDPKTFHFTDDGLVPNNPLPFLIYEKAVDVGGGDPEAAIEELFTHNGWGHQLWRNGIFYYLHYHATVHEVLGIACGTARVKFGGDAGEAIGLRAGDVAILPAGTGHQCLETSADFKVVGGYPPGAKMQITRPTKDNHRKALRTIPKVAMPDSDPVQGKEGPLTRLWKALDGSPGQAR